MIVLGLHRDPWHDTGAAIIRDEEAHTISRRAGNFRKIDQQTIAKTIAHDELAGGNEIAGQWLHEH